MTAQTFTQLVTYMHKFKNKLHYASYPVLRKNAKEDVLVEPNGRRTKLCF